MTNGNEENTYVTATYTIPPEWKEWIERIAAEQDLNRSQVMRRILREHFDRADVTPKPTSNKKVGA